VVTADADLDGISEGREADDFNRGSGRDSQLEEPLMDRAAAGDVAHHVALARLQLAEGAHCRLCSHR
jgi:hypothetical protein